MKNLKNLLTNGVFGIMSTGEKFVVVGDRIIYQDGGYDRVNSMDEDLDFRVLGKRVDKLFNACSFNNLTSCEKDNTSVVFNRKDRVEMTIEEIEKKLGIKNLFIKGNK